jgi:dienelactone hydrolase
VYSRRFGKREKIRFVEDRVIWSKYSVRLLQYLLMGLTLTSAMQVWAQGEPDYIHDILKDDIISAPVAEYQVRQYIIRATAPLPKLPATSQEWALQANRLRQHLLNDVVYHGWPKEWVDSAPKFQETGVIETGGGYRIHKLRYEIVPGFESAALLYEPINVDGKIPAIVSLAGHDGPQGYAYPFKQKRCIAWAKHGVMVLSLEWFSYGELNKTGNDHLLYGAHLDLVGANVLGIFYLEMRRGLDYLYNYPGVDRNRIGVTGLSGGGWQTIVLSSLDERVKAANPVAGFSSLRSRVEVKDYGDIGDIEQSPPDFLQNSDYPYLVGLMAPRPTLLTYNAEDDCCFRAMMVKPRIYDAIKPFFKLSGKEDLLTWHENRDPATHNYEIDNRLADYSFFTKQFGLPLFDSENGIPAEIRDYEELKAGLPDDNLTILDLARKMGKEINREPIPSDVSAKAGWANSQRSKLRETVRYKPVDVQDVWGVAVAKHQDIQSVSYLFSMSNQLSVNGMWLRSILQSSDAAPVTIVLNDKGIQTSKDPVSYNFSRGDQVLALDLMFMGSEWKNAAIFGFAQMLDSVGDRTIGLQAAQLIRIARWAKQRAGVAKIKIDATGIRSQGITLVAAGLEPDLFSDIRIREGMHSLSYLLDKPVAFDQAPELFCLDLYKNFDIDSLEALTAPAKIQAASYVELLQH